MHTWAVSIVFFCWSEHSVPQCLIQVIIVGFISSKPFTRWIVRRSLNLSSPGTWAINTSPRIDWSVFLNIASSQSPLCTESVPWGLCPRDTPTRRCNGDQWERSNWPYHPNSSRTTSSFVGRPHWTPSLGFARVGWGTPTGWRKRTLSGRQWLVRDGPGRTYWSASLHCVQLTPCRRCRTIRTPASLGSWFPDWFRHMSWRPTGKLFYSFLNFVLTCTVTLSSKVNYMCCRALCILLARVAMTSRINIWKRIFAFQFKIVLILLQLKPFAYTIVE